MDDLISRQAAIEAVMNHYRVGDKPQNEEMDWCVEMLNELPTAEKKGRWIPLSDGWAECSSCEHLERAAGLRWRYCPNCGARMEESE